MAVMDCLEDSDETLQRKTVMIRSGRGRGSALTASLSVQMHIVGGFFRKGSALVLLEYASTC